MASLTVFGWAVLAIEIYFLVSIVLYMITLCEDYTAYLNGDAEAGDRIIEEVMIFSASTLACICVLKILEAFGINVCEWINSKMYQPGTGGTGGAEGGSGESTGGESGSGTINGFDKTVNAGKQGKHILGNDNYIEGRSIFNGTVDDAQKLVDEFAGTGEWIGQNKERVNFGKVFGKYVNPSTGENVDTTVGMIHYSKTGTHIVPAQPIE